jgi:hypothetical protein
LAQPILHFFHISQSEIRFCWLVGSIHPNRNTSSRVASAETVLIGYIVTDKNRATAGKGPDIHELFDNLTFVSDAGLDLVNHFSGKTSESRPEVTASAFRGSTCLRLTLGRSSKMDGEGDTLVLYLNSFMAGGKGRQTWTYRIQRRRRRAVTLDRSFATDAVLETV